MGNPKHWELKVGIGFGGFRVWDLMASGFGAKGCLGFGLGGIQFGAGGIADWI